ncbi:condensation domain-containing protein [Gordonia otitidis]|uniref:condensation domain-containing protein n=1 Tax=Gordonia otitidis TaxID=249058 RepID=UPI001D13306E|nr:condensation domain-containing protein [Gordonia otitidis]UEA59388.1 condensation domain-containing protein [Gordonia otitidis]
MVNFGLIDEWQPRAGRVTSWTLSPEAIATGAKAPLHPVPPSHQQEEYLHAALRNESAGFRFSRLCLEAFDFQSPLDPDAFARAVTTFLRRHDTYLSWFSVEADGTIARHVVDPDIVELSSTEHGDIANPADIRTLVSDNTPGPFAWNCFTFGAIEWDGGFTLYAAVDHLNTDGISQALTCVELITLYSNEAFGLDNPVPEIGSYLRYCEHERSVSRELTPESNEVRRWIELIRNNGGELPHFPLPLGTDSEGYTRSGHVTESVFDEAAAQRFEKTCKENGANMTAGLLAVAAIAYCEFTGEAEYLAMTPKSTRAAGRELNSVGWFTSLIPVPIRVGPAATFTDIATVAGRSYTKGKELTDVSLHRVAQLVGNDDGIDIPVGWTVPMFSYIDVRKLPGVDLFDAINGCLYGNRGSSEEVFMWVNRFTDHTSMSFLFPDTDEGRDSLALYAEKVKHIMRIVADQGDYQPQFSHAN